ncbi:L-serine ammonia-lyase [Asticcacaulis benevestitus]|uniref:L-serine dehydratase n=1 Tax=Asticcacaulis benevestitus DSM 16100 = ATCC BAA-896 TaxID=1121022 RepID=V4PS69_9CAUL|nr:L-serine ammonia-lyase [Asticcacaulis benevestitus]ESQ91141.1 serine dehydratase [Asticcacaulis benevestitus DSM 16100 = ATCC BAA-896]
MTAAAKLPWALSVTDLFTIGIGPSSSHTVGPMRAAVHFAEQAVATATPTRVICQLYGSLALTGKGHATDTAVLVGLCGWLPDRVDPEAIAPLVTEIRATQSLKLAGVSDIVFDPEIDLQFMMGEFLPEHSNGLRFEAHYADNAPLIATYFSIGGGAITGDTVINSSSNIALPYAYGSGADLLAICHKEALTIAEVVARNEQAFRAEAETHEFIDAVRTAMMASIERGCAIDGTLPGGLNVKRRAKAMRDTLIKRGPRIDPSQIFEWVSLYALSVNEENAAGGRVVTAPTNGAAGVLPAVIKYYETFVPGATAEGSRTLLMTAAAIGFLYKNNASISAAEMGCQGEVGVACSMAAAGLCAALGGTPGQIENAAEIGMEHNLGLTCDPIGGLVQVPCIERNTMGAIKAINATYLALNGDGQHIVSLDAVIETMRQTGEDMRSKYKETSLGGLAVNVVEC